MPERGGSIEQLKKYVNVSARHWPLLLAWLTAALRPRGPYPVLVLTGEQGSAKTTLAQVCRRLVDPHAALLRSLPRSERDLMVSAHNNWLLAFDNISKLTDWQSDSVCRLSTGGGFAARGLFTDDREMFLSAQRPIILNGIDDFVTRGDLVDRSIFLSLPRIRPDQRRSDEAFWAEFDRDYPALFGSLLDAVAGGIRFWPVRRARRAVSDGRPGPLGRSGLAPLDAPPGTFVDAYRANRRSACADALEESPVAAALVAIAGQRARGRSDSHRAASDLDRLPACARIRRHRMAQVTVGPLEDPPPPGRPAPRNRNLRRVPPSTPWASREDCAGRPGTAAKPPSDSAPPAFRRPQRMEREP